MRSPPTPGPFNSTRNAPRRITAAAEPTQNKNDLDRAFADSPERSGLTRLCRSARGLGALYDKGRLKKPCGMLEGDQLDPKNSYAYATRGFSTKNGDPIRNRGFTKPSARSDDANATWALYGRRRLQEGLRNARRQSNWIRRLGRRLCDARGYLRHTGEYDLAIADLNEAIRLDPKDAAVYANRGGVYAMKGDFDAAIADCTEAIRLDPKNAKAYNTRGWAHWRQEGTRRGDRRLHRGHSPQSARRQGASATWSAVLAQKGEYDKAIADLDAAIRLNPTLPLFVRGRVPRGASSAGHCDRGIADFQTVFRLNPRMRRRHLKPGQKRPISPEPSTRPAAGPADAQGSSRHGASTATRHRRSTNGRHASSRARISTRRYSGIALRSGASLGAESGPLTQPWTSPGVVHSDVEGSVDSRAPEEQRGTRRTARTVLRGVWCNAVFELYNSASTRDFQSR